MFRRIKERLWQQFKKYEIRTHELSYLFWECTLRCNLNCLHCGSDCTREAAVEDMPLTDFLNVLDDINLMSHRRTTVVVTGGEPLLRPDLAECGKAIRAKGFRWGIVTNGYAYTEERHIALMNAGMGAVTLSLDGLEDTHNWLRRRPDSFRRAVVAMKLMAREKRLNFDVVTCVHRRNLKELEAIRLLLIGNGVRRWRLFTIAPIGRARHNGELQLSPGDLKTLMDFIECSRKDHRIAVNFSCEGYVGEYEGRVRDHFFFCRAGINIGSVLVNGDISACPNINRSFVQGNIYREPFTKVWNEQYQLFRNREWTRVGKCARCKSYNTCGGNGMHLWDESRDGVLRCYREMPGENRG